LCVGGCWEKAQVLSSDSKILGSPLEFQIYFDFLIVNFWVFTGMLDVTLHTGMPDVELHTCLQIW
jgi:hypothetical protein